MENKTPLQEAIKIVDEYLGLITEKRMCGERGEGIDKSENTFILISVHLKSLLPTEKQFAEGVFKAGYAHLSGIEGPGDDAPTFPTYWRQFENGAGNKDTPADQQELAIRADERERVEGEFAEWCDENSYRRNMKGLWYKTTGGSEDYALHTTAELTKLFLKSKTDKQGKHTKNLG